MLKSSSLCLYSSNLGTFWLKIVQFWPFEEISISVMAGILDTGRRYYTILKGDQRIMQSLVEIDSVGAEDFFKISPPFFLICMG